MPKPTAPKPPAKPATQPRFKRRVPRLFVDETGNWYWKPEKRLRPDFKNQALGKGVEAAQDAARALNKQVEDWLAVTNVRQPKALRPSAQPHTVGQLVGLYKTSTAWKKLRASTQDQYTYELRRIEDEFGHEVAQTLGRGRVSEWAQALAYTAPATAGHLVARGRALFEWAAGIKIARTDNPFAKHRIASGGKRGFRFRWEDIAHILEVAEQEGRPSVGVALAIGFATVQRISDVIGFHDGQLVETRDGVRLSLEQSKRKKVGKGGQLDAKVTIDMRLPGLVADLLARHPPKLRRAEGEREARLYWIVSEETDRPYHEKTIARVFTRVIEAAIARDPKRWGHLAGGQLRDGRRSGFVHRIVKGATVEQVCSVSGHSLKEGYDIVEHYLPRTSELADQADAFMQVRL